MLKAGVASLNHWTSLILGRDVASTDSQRRYARILQGLITAIAGRGMSVIVSFLSVPLTLGYLGAERYGVWMTISTLLAWLSLADIGLGNSLTNALSEAYAANQRDQAKVHVASVFWMLCGTTLLLGGLFALIWHWINWGYLLNVTSPAASSEVSSAIAVAVAVFLFSFPL